LYKDHVITCLSVSSHCHFPYSPLQPPLVAHATQLSMITKLLVRIKCPSWKVRRCSHAVQYIALFGGTKQVNQSHCSVTRQIFVVRKLFLPRQYGARSSCSSTEAVKWPSNHTKFVKVFFHYHFQSSGRALMAASHFPFSHQ